MTIKICLMIIYYIRKRQKLTPIMKKRTTSLKPLVVFYWRVYSPIGGNWSVDFKSSIKAGLLDVASRMDLQMMQKMLVLNK